MIHGDRRRWAGGRPFERRMMIRYGFLFASLLLLASGCGHPPATLAERGLQEARAGKYDEAIATCDQAISEDPKDATAFYSRGLAYQYRNREGDLNKAVADFTESIRLAPRKVDAYLSRSVAYRDMGDMERSEADQSAARELDTELKEVYAQLPPTEEPVIPLPKPAPAPEEPKSDILDGLRPRRSQDTATEDSDSLLPRRRPFESSGKSKSRVPDELPSTGLIPPTRLPSAGVPKATDGLTPPAGRSGVRPGGVSGILDDQPGPSFDPLIESPLERPRRQPRRPQAGAAGPAASAPSSAAAIPAAEA